MVVLIMVKNQKLSKAFALSVLLTLLFSSSAVLAESLTFVYPNEKNAFHDAAADIVSSA
ncbi:MAG: hypothetical protein ISQ90_04645 [Rhodospirillales bacterium]|nr:hypothetical protein [Rhodospirillales bacterium]